MGTRTRFDNGCHIVNSVPGSPVAVDRYYAMNVCSGCCSNKASASVSLQNFPVDDVKRDALLNRFIRVTRANWAGPSAHSTGDLTFNYLTMKMITYNGQASPHIFYIRIYPLGYKIKTVSLLKQVNFTKQNTRKTRRQFIVIAAAAVTRSSVVQ